MRPHLKHFLLFPLLLICCISSAQVTDSLKKVLINAKTPAERAALQIGIGFSYLRDHVDSSERYYTMGSAIARDINDDSLILEAELLNARIYDRRDKKQEALKYYDESIKKFRDHKYYMRLIVIFFSKGDLQHTMNDHLGSIASYKEALQYARMINRKTTETRASDFLANQHILLGEYDQAFNYLTYSIKINDSLKRYTSVAINYNRIVSLLGRQKKYKEALKYGRLADSIVTAQADSELIHSFRTNLAIIYKNLGEYDKAIRIYEDAARFFKNDTCQAIYIYVNLGVAYISKGDYTAAKKCLFAADAMNKRNCNDEGIEFSLSKELENIYFKTGKYDSAVYYGKIAEKVGAKDGYENDEYKECIALLADIYLAKGEIPNAKLYYKKYQDMQDSVIARMRSTNLAEAEAKFNLGEKNIQLTALLNENEAQRSKVQQQYFFNVVLIAGLIVGVVILVVIVIAYRGSIRKNALLSEQKGTIDKQVIQLANAAEAKSRFFANISHELRTPVTLLTGMLGLVRDKQELSTEKEREQLNIAYNNSRKLQVMIEEMLDLSRLEKVDHELKISTKEIAPLLKRMVTSFDTLIEDKQLSLEYNDERSRNTFIAIDENKFEKIINNLIYNAIKFNEKGGWIKVDTNLSADRKQLIIRVADSGKGISKEDLPHIFERFYQGNSTTYAKAEGAGIGLSLVKELTTLLSGTVNVISSPETGTVFTLEFPVTDAPVVKVTETDEILPLPVETWEKFDRKPVVLMAEDNPEMRYYVKEILGQKVNIAEASNGKEALSWLERNTPDIIISDIMMPEMDGREFVTELKKSEQYKKIPVIMLTALSNNESRLNMLGLGIDDYIIKPFDPDELRIRVYNLLNNAEERKQYNLQPVEPEDIQPDNTPVGEFKEKITAYVSERLKSEISVYELAMQLNLSERQFYRLAKSLTGYTPAQLIKEVRLQKAYELLTEGKVNKVEDVVKRVGFENISYFSRQFLDRFGKRPSEFL